MAGGRVPPGWLEDNDMSNDANIDLAGFVASEPSFRRLTTGTSHAKLRVAYTERRLNRETGEWGDGPTSFVTVLCWRSLADNVAMCLRKGEPVLVRGRLRVREYEGKDGSRGTETEIDASSIGHDLSRGVAHFSRTRRAPGETAAENAEAQAGPASQDGEEPANPASPEDPAGRDEPGRPDGPPAKRTAGKGAAGKNGAGKGGADETGPGEGSAGENGASVLDDDAVAQLASQLSGSPGGAGG